MADAVRRMRVRGGGEGDNAGGRGRGVAAIRRVDILAPKSCSAFALPAVRPVPYQSRRQWHRRPRMATPPPVPTKRKVLVTGAAGNIGSYFAEHSHNRYALRLMVRGDE